MAGTLTVTGMTTGLLAGQRTIGPITMTGTSPVGTILDLTLPAGDTTIAVPAGATSVLIVLPSNNSAVLRVRSNLNPADAGLAIATTGWAAWPLATGVTSLTLNASSPATGLELTFN